MWNIQSFFSSGRWSTCIFGFSTPMWTFIAGYIMWDISISIRYLTIKHGGYHMVDITIHLRVIDPFSSLWIMNFPHYTLWYTKTLLWYTWSVLVMFNSMICLVWVWSLSLLWFFHGPFSEQFPLDGPYMVVKEIDDFPLAMATWPLGDACWSDCISH